MWAKITTYIALMLCTVLIWALPIKATDENELIEIFNEVGEIYCICPELLQSIAFYESSYKADAVNGSCKGLMQISETSHKTRIKKIKAEYRISNNIYNARLNVLVGADYLAELFDEYEDVGLVLMIYNGQSNAVELAEQGKLSRYAEKVLKKSEELERMNGK